MTTTTKNSKLTTGQLNAPVARSVGAVHVTLGLLGVAVAVMLAFLVKPVESLAGYFGPAQLPYPALPVILGVLSAVMVVAGVQLLRKHSGALSVLLLINLLDLAGAIAIALAAAVWKESPWSEAVQTLPRIVIRAILAAACVRVPADRSRLRYASLVMVSIVAAVALTVVVNIIAQADYWRRDVQTLGRFGLSDRTKTIIRSLETPVRLTCVYTSVQQDKSPADYRPRVMELLQEMQEQNDLLEVFSVTTDAEKARLVGRLRRQLGSRAEPQIECLKDFQASSDKLIRKLRRHQQRWMQVDENAYPNIWSLPAEFARHLETRAAEVEKTAAKVRDALSGTGLPDYAKVVEELTGTLESTQTTLREISSLLKKLAGIPPAVAANRKAAMDSVGKCTAAAKAMAKTVADSAATQSADPADILKKFITQADRLAAQARRAGQMLDNVAGKENSTLVRNSRYWIVNRTELGELYRLVAAAVEQRARDAEAMLKAAKAEYQKKAIGQLRAEVAEFHKLLSQSQAAAETATTKLATVDAPMQAIFQQAGTGKLLGQLIESLAAQVKKIRELPKLDSETLASEITGDNIVIIEAAGKAEAVSFDEVWPLKVPRWSGPAGSEELRKRTFNGNAAIGSRILTMTNQPFATVLLCHYQPQVPPQMRRMIPPADISPQRLAGLRRRLEEANFKVGDWNLAAGPRPDAVEGRPQVLLILPPAASMPMPQAYGQQIPRFGPREVQTIRQAIDASTPAIFLTHFVWPRALGMFMPPTQPPYALGAYLSKDWGIDVQTHYRFIPAVVDESGPDRFKIDPIRFRYFPLSTFTDHPVGKPLQARRLMWNDLCPILHAGNSTGSGVKSPPVGVTIQSLLTVPAGLNATWATSDLQRLGQQLQARTGGFISPQADDLKPPLDVAVAATRAEGENVGPARIVVLTAAASLMDGYLEARIPQLDAKGAIALTDPPRANADVVVNSAYWLIGREGFIAAGPAQVRPVAIIAPAAMATLKILILIVLPLAVLALGGGVMLVRRR